MDGRELTLSELISHAISMKAVIKPRNQRYENGKIVEHLVTNDTSFMLSNEAYLQDEWEAHIGGDVHVRLGECVGEFVGIGDTPEKAVQDLIAQMVAYNASP